MTSIPAHAFKKIILPPELSDWNRAILNMLRALPPDTSVVLWWH